MVVVGSSAVVLERVEVLEVLDLDGPDVAVVEVGVSTSDTGVGLVVVVRLRDASRRREQAGQEGAGAGRATNRPSQGDGISDDGDRVGDL